MNSLYNIISFWMSNAFLVTSYVSNNYPVSRLTADFGQITKYSKFLLGLSMHYQLYSSKYPTYH